MIINMFQSRKLFDIYIVRCNVYSNNFSLRLTVNIETHVTDQPRELGAALIQWAQRG